MLGAHLLYVRSFSSGLLILHHLKPALPIYGIIMQKNKPRLKKLRNSIKGRIRVHVKNNKNSLLFKILDCYKTTRDFELNYGVIDKDA